MATPPSSQTDQDRLDAELAQAEAEAAAHLAEHEAAQEAALAEFERQEAEKAKP